MTIKSIADIQRYARESFLLHILGNSNQHPSRKMLNSRVINVSAQLYAYLLPWAEYEKALRNAIRDNKADSWKFAFHAFTQIRPAYKESPLGFIRGWWAKNSRIRHAYRFVYLMHSIPRSS